MVAPEVFPSLAMDQMADFDQHHAYTFEVHDTQQNRIPICRVPGPAMGRPCPVSKGGVMPPRRTKRQASGAGLSQRLKRSYNCREQNRRNNMPHNPCTIFSQTMIIDDNCRVL